MHKFFKRILLTQYPSLSSANKTETNAKRSIRFRWFPNLNIHTTFKPATLAILVQAFALLLALAFGYAWQLNAFKFFNLSPGLTFLHLAIAQSILATALSKLVGMEKWWHWIHACFPLALWAMAQWTIPPETYLIAFIITLSLYWTTFRTQVPFFPSRPIAWRHVLQLMPSDRPVHLIDIGSGIGDMVMHVAEHGRKISRESSFTGIEIAVLPWLVSYVRAYLKRSNAIFRLGNYYELNFAQYDMVFAYLSPAAMVKLWEKASSEMRPGSLLISYEFEIPGVEPHVFIPGAGNSPALYAWKIAHTSS